MITIRSQLTAIYPIISMFDCRSRNRKIEEETERKRVRREAVGDDHKYL